MLKINTETIKQYADTVEKIKDIHSFFTAACDTIQVLTAQQEKIDYQFEVTENENIFGGNSTLTVTIAVYTENHGLIAERLFGHCCAWQTQTAFIDALEAFCFRATVDILCCLRG